MAIVIVRRPKDEAPTEFKRNVERVAGKPSRIVGHNYEFHYKVPNVTGAKTLVDNLEKMLPTRANYNISIKESVQEAKMSGMSKEYKAFVDAAIKKLYGKRTLGDLNDNETNKLFRYIEKNWNSKSEKGKDGPIVKGKDGVKKWADEIVKAYESADASPEAYKQFVNKSLEKMFPGKSLGDLDDAETKKFFAYIEKNWNSDDEKGKDGPVNEASSKPIDVSKLNLKGSYAVQVTWNEPKDDDVVWHKILKAADDYAKKNISAEGYSRGIPDQRVTFIDAYESPYSAVLIVPSENDAKGLVKAINKLAVSTKILSESINPDYLDLQLSLDELGGDDPYSAPTPGVYDVLNGNPDIPSSESLYAAIYDALSNSITPAAGDATVMNSGDYTIESVNGSAYRNDRSLIDVITNSLNESAPEYENILKSVVKKHKMLKAPGTIDYLSMDDRTPSITADIKGSNRQLTIFAGDEWEPGDSWTTTKSVDFSVGFEDALANGDQPEETGTSKDIKSLERDLLKAIDKTLKRLNEDVTTNSLNEAVTIKNSGGDQKKDDKIVKAYKSSDLNGQEAAVLSKDGGKTVSIVAIDSDEAMKPDHGVEPIGFISKKGKVTFISEATEMPSVDHLTLNSTIADAIKKLPFKHLGSKQNKRLGSEITYLEMYEPLEVFIEVTPAVSSYDFHITIGNTMFGSSSVKKTGNPRKDMDMLKSAVENVLSTLAKGDLESLRKNLR